MTRATRPRLPGDPRVMPRAPACATATPGGTPPPSLPPAADLRPWRPAAGDVLDGVYLGPVVVSDFPPRRPDHAVRDARGRCWRLDGGKGLGAAVAASAIRPGEAIRVRRCPRFDVERGPS